MRPTMPRTTTSSTSVKPAVLASQVPVLKVRILAVAVGTERIEIEVPMLARGEVLIRPSPRVRRNPGEIAAVLPFSRQWCRLRFSHERVETLVRRWIDAAVELVEIQRAFEALDVHLRLC